MKLKTLRDIDFGDSTRIVENLLRQEAIKWIKELKKYDEQYLPIGMEAKIPKKFEEFYDSEFPWSCDPPVEWIKHFFNITKEELKE